MKRIIWHWTGGSYGVTDDDKQHYHHIIDERGYIHDGVHPHSANESTTDGVYAAHTRGANKDSIGIAIDAMAGASETDPWRTTNNPPTRKQVETLCRLTAVFCLRYGITPGPKTTLNHGEVQANLGIKQSGKWDICRLPWIPKGENVGDWMRDQVRAYMTELTAPRAMEAAPAAKEEDVTKEELLEIGKRAASEAVSAATDKELVAASTVKVESGGSTSEFKLNGIIIGAVAALAAIFGYDMSQEEQMALFQNVSLILGGIGSVYTTARTWRKNQPAA